MSNPTINVTLRHGISPPHTVQLSAVDMKNLSFLPVDTGLDYLLKRIPNPNGFATSFRKTLQDPHCVIEIRQSDTVRVITGKQLAQERIQPGTGKPLSDIEIGVSKAQAGG